MHWHDTSEIPHPVEFLLIKHLDGSIDWLNKHGVRVYIGGWDIIATRERFQWAYYSDICDYLRKGDK